MVEFRRVQMSYCLILLLQVTAVTEQLSLTVKEAKDVTLLCEHAKDDQDKCDNATWSFRVSERAKNVELVTHGHVNKLEISKSHRLSVAENCSLVIKKVTDEDAGRYSCRQFNESEQKGSPVYLSVVTMTEHKDNDKVTVTCSLSTYKLCNHTVKWQFKEADKEFERNTSQSLCSANVTIKTSDFIYTSKNYDSLSCEVTKDKGKVWQFIFREKTQPDWWKYMLGPVALAALLITIVTVVLVRRKRNKGNKSQIDENMAEPCDGVSYASINYSRKSNSTHQIWDGDTVTYSTVKPHSSSDPNNLYAAIN